MIGFLLLSTSSLAKPNFFFLYISEIELIFIFMVGGRVGRGSGSNDCILLCYQTSSLVKTYHNLTLHHWLQQTDVI